MITYSTALATLQQITGVQTTDTVNSAFLMQYWNDSRRTVGAIRGGTWPWLEIERTVNTVQDQNFLYVPNDMRKVTAVRVVVGTGTSATVYLPYEVCDIKKWQLILAYHLGSNQYPYFCYQQGQKLLFSPIPSVTDTPVIITGHQTIRDINIADYTTGTIASIANGATMVTGSGTTWTSGMAGQYIRITQTNAANGGDGYWYEIASITSSTILELVKPYQGTTISAGSAAYTMGPATYLPEAWQMAPIFRATAQYWNLKENMVLANSYWRQYDGGLEAGLLPPGSAPGGIVGQMLEEASETFDGSYIKPSDKQIANLQQAPYYFPTQDASGFN